MSSADQRRGKEDPTEKRKRLREMTFERRLEGANPIYDRSDPAKSGLHRYAKMAAGNKEKRRERAIRRMHDAVAIKKISKDILDDLLPSLKKA